MVDPGIIRQGGGNPEVQSTGTRKRDAVLEPLNVDRTVARDRSSQSDRFADSHRGRHRLGGETRRSDRCFRGLDEEELAGTAGGGSKPQDPLGNLDGRKPLRERAVAELAELVTAAGPHRAIGFQEIRLPHAAGGLHYPGGHGHE